VGGAQRVGAVSGALADRARSLVRFAAGGVASATVVLGVSAFVAESGLASERIAAGVGLVTSFAVNFVVLRRFVFRGTERPVARQALEFAASSAVFRGLEYLAFLAVHALLPLHYLVSLVLVLGTSFGAKFLWYEGRVFRRG